MPKRFILLVDDEQNILNALRRELEEWAESHDLELLTALSAKAGLGLLETHGADTVLVVSDLKMPEMKGSDFLQQVRDAYPGIVTLLLTGYSETDEIIKAVRAGIFSYILKPWDSDYLLSELQKAYDHGELKRQNERYLHTMQEELKWAGEMQKAMLRPALPSSEGVEFRVSYRPVPALYCGGDYYDVISLAADRYLLLLGDVAGHGVRAAIVTGILKAVIYPEYVRTALARDFSPGEFLSWLNGRLNFELRRTSGLIVSFLACVMDLKSGLLRYANAGQCKPGISRAGTYLELPVSGSALGFSANVLYMDQTIPLLKNDVIALHTDGLVEFAGKKGPVSLKAESIFGGASYGADYHRQVMQSALEQAGAEDFTDDVTILSARVL